ncbi:large exoprotein containing haemagglutination activity domain [Thioploca ingrica]|uniref:Large exoprotein containing haemagglutination activity domain n=1 Tax=Thioploca ingrica TaxID=40754 RepID=A0A090BVN6_9GAMM|nr:large exoprotein containing haemagglutination activity domain [Thioploca ingrica]
MSLKSSLPLFSLLCTFTPSSFAEITLDGSLGRSGALIGPDYAITADLGKQIGGNLFHSFRDFNLYQHESATFSGPNSINNVISRVTGGKPSQINGTLRSTIPNADVYLLNPAGILFGEGAELDVQGGFHASTADTLRLGSDGEFNASDIEQSVLTVAAPSAFGFLAAKPAAITLQDSKLSVPTGKTLSLIGGDLQLNGIHTDETFSTKLSVESGRLNLASFASPGEVIPTQFGLDINPQTLGGTITANGTQMEVKEGGQIFIRGGQLNLTDSQIKSETTNAGNSGNIEVKARQVSLKDGAIIRNITLSSQTSGSEVKARQVSLKDGAIIRNITLSSQTSGSIVLIVSGLLTIQSSFVGTPGVEISGTGGKSGDIKIAAGQIILTNGGQVSSSTSGSQESGFITIKVDGDLTISSSNEINAQEFIPSGIFSESTSEETNAGNAGNITIEAEQITLTPEAEVSSSIQGHGKAGSIEIKARQIKLDEAKVFSKTEGYGEAGTIIITTAGTLNLSGSSEISTNSAPVVDRPNEMSDAGKIKITAQAVNLDDSTITSNTTGKGGSVTLDVKDALNIQSGGITTQSRQTGDAGKIDIAARQLKLTQGGEINSTTYGSGKGGSIKLNVSDTLTVSGRKSTFISSRIFGGSNRSEQMGEAGDAGTISIEANKINLIDSGKITTSTHNASGGDISITVPNSLYLQAGKISTDVSGGDGNGGNIAINNPQLTTLNKSQIIANAYEGNGGNIDIIADQFIRSADSLVDASSRLGIDGEINIEAKSYVGNGLITSPKNFLNPPPLQRCETQFATKETSSRFTRANRSKMRRDELKEGVWGSPLDF